MTVRPRRRSYKLAASVHINRPSNWQQYEDVPSSKKKDTWDSFQKQLLFAQGKTSWLYAPIDLNTTPSQPISYLGRCFILNRQLRAGTNPVVLYRWLNSKILWSMISTTLHTCVDTHRYSRPLNSSILRQSRFLFNLLWADSRLPHSAIDGVTPQLCVRIFLLHRKASELYKSLTNKSHYTACSTSIAFMRTKNQPTLLRTPQLSFQHSFYRIRSYSFQAIALLSQYRGTGSPSWQFFLYCFYADHVTSPHRSPAFCVYLILQYRHT